MPNMPTLGPPPKRSSGGWLIGALIVAAIGFGSYRYYQRHQARLSPDGTAPVTVAPLTPSPSDGGAPVANAAPAPATPTSGTPAVAASPAEDHGPKAVSFSLEGALETSLAEKVGNEVAPALAQVLTRTLVWWVEVPNELMRGDKVDLVYEIASDGQPQVDALRLVSGKYGKTFSAFRYQAKGDTFSRLYEPDGLLLEKHLVSAPLDSYEQVTSLLRDGRHHKGVDFKTPVGSKVRATFTGTITRKNWNWHGNGNCLELTESAAPHRHALYLHLSPIPASVHVGQTVTKGQVFAESGNTGHSFAPHLHYQLMAADGKKVLDPFESQPTRRIGIAADQKAALEAAIAQLSAQMAPAVASAAGK